MMLEMNVCRVALEPAQRGQCQDKTNYIAMSRLHCSPQNGFLRLSKLRIIRARIG